MNKSSKLYSSDLTEESKQASDSGDVEVLVAGEKEKVENYEKAGNQSKEYYKK